jgi:2-polyprenyl-3-methyl-5-hydroxy-6-metoxy-1,4-benzoquinol methylase
MIRPEQFHDYPLTKQVFQTVNKNYSLFAKTYIYILDNFDVEYLTFCEEILNILQQKSDEKSWLEKCVKAFVKYSHEYLVLQTKLNKTKKYLHTSFCEVNDSVYQNQVMDEYYLDGLLLSQFLWPNHYKMGRYFLEQRNSSSSSSEILDVPSGAGIYSYFVSRYFKFRRLFSIDISPYASSYTRSLVSSAADRRVNFMLPDVFDFDEDCQFDLIVCGELLEHLESPERLLEFLGARLKQDGTLFLTTAIYAAAIDHIYLFHNVNEVRSMLGQHYKICSELVLPVSLESDCPEMGEIPINYACVLKKL